MVGRIGFITVASFATTTILGLHQSSWCLGFSGAHYGPRSTAHNKYGFHAADVPNIVTLVIDRSTHTLSYYVVEAPSADADGDDDDNDDDSVPEYLGQRVVLCENFQPGDEDMCFALYAWGSRPCSAKILQ